MNVKVKTRKLYDIEIQGKTYKGLEKVGEMAGMVHLKDSRGNSLVLDINNMGEVFSRLFDGEIDAKIVKASPEFL